MKKLILLTLVLTSLSFSCRRGQQDTDLIPNVPVGLTVNLDLPAYFDLTLLGNWMYFPDGYRGLIVYHAFDGEYYAFDRSCSYQPQNTCSQLWVDSVTLVHMYCGTYVNGQYEKCCDSRFEIPMGFPVQGPAINPMKQYAIRKSGNTLFISN
ncbi:MAG: hypothetical protein LPK45_05815 [Bacteroidota bacterium]|nr:hypothetical protein [Bacteroidota bacterium]MDX5430583.1 hypothetical protein [Bacteroidota bacterium]MDX5469335.1 hypothetical protein [Bacteroidota bacterium]